MKIFDTYFKWTGKLLTRPLTRKIVLHHRAGEGDVLSIHNTHLKNGWSGIGYHFYVRKDGSIYRGRPIEKVGAHTEGNNMDSVGICFEGNFEKDIMDKAQLESGRLLIAHIEECYGRKLEIKRHSDFGATLCPGKNFPFEEIKKASCDDLVSKMFSDGVISFSNIRNWELFLSGKSRPKAEYIRAVIKRYQAKNQSQ
ncbi:MAG: N-acetylmuramoyl-L-alanine amidase [Clostridia bacterium]|nr:N-acetylmuramoyl-L-alanine amidase [Clostridia bacterium]